VPERIGCTVILVHGIGDQKPDWSKKFRNKLKIVLGQSSTRVVINDAYWATLSTWEKPPVTTLAAARGAGDAEFENNIRNQAFRQISLVLEADMPVRSLTFGPGNIIDKIKNAFGSAGDVVEDIGNYVGSNEIRTAIQQVVHSKLADADASNIPSLLIAHSQGTVICYDVLRQAGGNYPHLHTWITMGSPLKKFYFSGLHWGKQQLGIPSGLRWVNIYDPEDIVGNELKGSVSWKSPVPEDHKVDNKHNAGDPHSHWNNPAVVKIIAAEIQKILALAAAPPVE
jgi:hypothetical protein